MLVNVHNPKVHQIHTHTEPVSTFHTVQLIDRASNGKVDLFIKGDWSDWDAMVAAVAQYRRDAALAAVAASVSRLEVLSIDS